jgi:hypothetical protein
MLTKRRDPFGRLLVAGFLTAPAAALLIDDAFAIDREMNMLPFGVLLATFGIGCLIDSGRRWVRVLAIVLLALMPVEFAYFYQDYFGDYRARSAEWFAPNVRGGLEAILAREDPAQPSRIYLDLEIGNVENYWTFYLIKHHRADLKAQTTYIRSNSFDAAAIPSRSFVFTEAKAPWHRDLVARKELSQILAVPEAGGGDPLYVLLQRP